MLLLPAPINLGGRFEFGAATVLVGWGGQDVSCYTTEGDVALLKDIHSTHRYVLNASLS